jgi:hypothetical protein
MFGDYSTFTYDYKQPNLGANEYIYTDDAHIYKFIFLTGWRSVGIAGRSVSN